jgi:hypothetical protein
MRTEITEPKGDFTLDFVAQRLQDFKPPQGPFDPRGRWQLTYGVYTFAAITAGTAPGGRAGTLSVFREPRDGGSVVELDFEKLLVGGSSQKVVARLVCRDDALGTPAKWDCSSEFFDREKKPLPQSVLRKSARLAGGRVEIDDGRYTQAIEIDGPFTVNWALFEAVGRLPRGPFAPLEFTMLDHFDQVKRGQTLAFRKSLSLTLGGRDVRLHAFDQLGRGIVPWVYWVDDSGRLLAALAGLEAYILDSFEK